MKQLSSVALPSVCLILATVSFSAPTSAVRTKELSPWETTYICVKNTLLNLEDKMERSQQIGKGLAANHLARLKNLENRMRKSQQISKSLAAIHLAGLKNLEVELFKQRHLANRTELFHKNKQRAD